MPLTSETPVIYDAVTLHIFAHMDRLDLLDAEYGHRPDPRWTDEVHAEVVRGRSHPESLITSGRILEATWMRAPGSPSDTLEVLRIQAALATPGRSQDKNLGEAESMALAIETGAIFVTDDKAAYDLARKRPDLGRDRVLDACSILGRA